jgi:uncharacterized protein (TIGR02453 family)
MTFEAFAPDTIAFLQGLSRHNDKAWFDAHRDDYEAHFVSAGKAFVEAAGARLAAFAPRAVAEPKINGSIFRINRDVRFSTDKTPYKDHLDFWFWEGQRRGAVSGYFLRVATDAVIIGAGCHGFDKDRLAAYRAAIARPGPAKALVAIVGDLEQAGHAVGGVQYQQPPRGVAVAAGAARLALHGALFVHATEPVAIATARGALVDTAAARWRAFAPLHDWITAHVQNA